MKSYLFSVSLVACCMLGPVPATHAGPATDALAVCITDNTTGRDRKDLVRWVFAVLANHPEIKSYSALTEADRDKLDREAATLFERLLTENCTRQAKAAIQADGPGSLRVAFQNLGQIASQELMRDSSVQTGFQRFTKLLNNQKLEAALK